MVCDIKELCQPKEHGGLGFRLFYEYNMVLLVKLGWKIASEEQSLWCKILKGKYLMNRTFFSHKPLACASGVWQGIFNARETLLKGACFNIRNGFF